MPSGVPIRIVAALSKTDKYRKPGSGMFDLIRDLYRSKGYEIDMSKSVYVGDAAGRLALGSRRKDHGDTDYKLALNVGLRFVTPEVCRITSSGPYSCEGLIYYRNTFWDFPDLYSRNRRMGFTPLRST